MQQFRFPYFRILAITFLLAVPISAIAGQVILVTVDGSHLSGELLAWDAAGVTLSAEGGPKTLALNQLLEIRWPSSETVVDSLVSSIELTDGARLPINGYVVADSQAMVSTPLSESLLRMPTSKVRRVQFTSLTDQLATLWSKLENEQLAGDILVVQKKQGTVLDYLTGLLGDITSEHFLFKWEGDQIPVRRSKVAALAYYHANEPKTEQAICWLHTQHGAKLPLLEATVEGKTLRVKTVGGLEFYLPQNTLAAADFSQGKLVYLSDLEPIQQTWTPRIALPGAVEFIQNHGLPRRDQSFSGSPLTLAWGKPTDNFTSKFSHASKIKTYSKGLAIRSRTEILYRLPPKMQRFVAIAGIDPATARQGSVTLEISADDRIVWHGQITGDNQPIEIHAQLEGARRLRIFVDYGENLDFGDRLHLVDARVIK